MPRNTAERSEPACTVFDLIERGDWSSVINKLCSEDGPAEASRQDHHGWLPLHRACEYGASEDVVYALLEAYPEGASQQLGFLPLHVAVTEGASPGVVRALLAVYPQGSGTKNRWGSLPIHLACDRSNICRETIRILLESYPEGAAVWENRLNSQLPIHHACRQMMEGEVIRMLVEAYPAGAFKANPWGHLPIHLILDASLSGRILPMKVVLSILDAYPDGARIKHPTNGWSHSSLFRLI